MPDLGDIASGKELGYKSEGYRVWAACTHCEKERWSVRKSDGSPVTEMCRVCSAKHNQQHPYGSDHHNWKGGSLLQGYVIVQVHPDDPMISMAGSARRCFEHRLVVARALGRPLKRHEIVHHINHVKDDNRLQNLQLFSSSRHNQISILEDRIAVLERKLARCVCGATAPIIEET